MGTTHILCKVLVNVRYVKSETNCAEAASERGETREDDNGVRFPSLFLKRRGEGFADPLKWLWPQTRRIFPGRRKGREASFLEA